MKNRSFGALASGGSMAHLRSVCKVVSEARLLFHSRARAPGGFSMIVAAQSTDPTASFAFRTFR